MTEVHRYIVIRPAEGLPEGFLPDGWDGLWLDADDMPAPHPWLLANAALARAVDTGRFERRDSDGATARVYEIQATDQEAH